MRAVSLEPRVPPPCWPVESAAAERRKLPPLVCPPRIEIVPAEFSSEFRAFFRMGEGESHANS